MSDTGEFRRNRSERTETQLIEELANLRRQVQELQRGALERHRSEDALRKSEERVSIAEQHLLDAIESISDGFVLFDASGRLVLCNNKYKEFYLYSDSDVVPGVHTRDLGRLDIERGTVALGAEDTEAYLDRRDKPIDASFRSYIIQLTDGRYLQTRDCWTASGGIVSIQTDITELKKTEENLRRSEERLKQAIESISEGFVLFDAEDRLVLCNERYREINQDIVNALKPGIKYETMLREAMSHRGVGNAEGEDWLQMQLTLHREPGKPFEERNENGRWIRVEDSRTSEGGYVGVRTDVTELKQAEEQLRQAQKMEAVGNLTGGVAHDFNNILAVILGHMELLEHRLGKDDTDVQVVIRAVERGAELTQRLLAFSRRQTLQARPTDLDSLIAEMANLLQRTLGETIEIEIKTTANLWSTLVDSGQVENALLNLTINARDAMPDGGKLVIETGNVTFDDSAAATYANAIPGDYVRLMVSDSGMGMAPQVLERAVEPFFTTKDVGEGSGLGLSMVYGFAQQSGGHVTIYSEPGEGTTIKLYLPRSTGTAAAEQKPATDEVPVAQGETVLVVEDDPDMRTLTVALLGSLGYRIMEAATGPAALEELGSTTRVNLLLTDLVLPGGMNGHELALEAERRAPGIKVLYMSGYAGNAVGHHGRLDADAALLQKPFRKAGLARAVRRVLDSRSD